MKTRCTKVGDKAWKWWAQNPDYPNAGEVAGWWGHVYKQGDGWIADCGIHNATAPTRNGAINATINKWKEGVGATAR